MPAAVFLGMHLLFTDPSTSPRSELGRILYGVMYGLGVVALYGLLGQIGAPTFYDKLLAVPLMNMTVQLIDVAVRSRLLRRFDPARLGPGLSPRQRNLVYMSIWVVAFVFVSDPTAAYRPRRWLPFWEQACAEDRRNGCLVLSRLEAQYCRQGSGWACNELGILQATGRAKELIPQQSTFELACSRGVPAGCDNGLIARAGAVAPGASAYRHSRPQASDYSLLLQEGQGPLDPLAPDRLYDRACQQGWADGCERLAQLRLTGRGTAPDSPGAAEALQRACDLKSWSACADLGTMILQGNGLPGDPARGRALIKRACEGGYTRACEGSKGSGQAGG
jgi:hypothetical protein